jgi:hypothetical protein
VQAPDVDDAVEELVLQDVLELGIEVDKLWLELSLLLDVEDLVLVVELLQGDVEMRVNWDDVFVLDRERVPEELEEDTLDDELLWDDDDVWLVCTDLDELEVELEDDWMILEL